MNFFKKKTEAASSEALEAEKITPVTKEGNGEVNLEIEGRKVEKIKVTNIPASNNELQPLIDRIDQLYKEKEVEKEKRLEAEKKLALLEQKDREVEKRVVILKAMQENNVNLMRKMISTVYKKLSADLQNLKK